MPLFLCLYLKDEVFIRNKLLMDVLKIGSRGEDVKKLQQLLVKAGYSVTVNSNFDLITEDAVEAFQKKNQLTPDGIVGNITWTKLENEKLVRPSFVINSTKFVLPTKNYFQEIQKKVSICLHHTAGWTIQKNSSANLASMNHFNWWTSRDLHVSTAYSIDYYGNIYEHFDPKYWAYHLGIGGKLAFLDKQSIGIEMCNEGAMKKVDGKFYWITNADKDGDGVLDEILVPYNRMENGLNDLPVHVEGGWRGYEYYAPYSQAQIDAILFLCKYLIDKFGISKNFITNNEYDKSVLLGYNGIFNHANCRKDKYDLSPAFPFIDFKNKL
jgi:N-acetyl-anhydromuramyl-L-alanine amidase AmpD